MKSETYRALVVREVRDGRFARRIEKKDISHLPAGEVLVRVRYSSLNYKDALSASGNRGVTRRYPHTPGIDAAGIVEESEVAEFAVGDAVIVAGFDLGMNTPGGFGQYIRVPASWVVKLTPGLTLKESMILGTAGFCAGLSVHELAGTVKPEQGDVLVTGATGGVGSVAVGVLSKLGYSVVAVSGKEDAATFLKPLGAKEVIDRRSFTERSSPALLRASWAGVIDTVGGEILATAIKSTCPLGVVTCCGNAASPELPLNVYPFILRGVTLIGIACQNCRVPMREAIMAKLANEWRFDQLEDIHDEISLAELDARIELMLRGGLKGRVVVNLDR
jgi:putative YhdH/YhfP family quinone oxidoreductase